MYSNNTTIPIILDLHRPMTDLLSLQSGAALTLPTSAPSAPIVLSSSWPWRGERWGTSRQVNRCLAPRLQEAPIALPLLEIHSALDAGCERRNIHNDSEAR
jgi:hypothetical protein